MQEDSVFTKIIKGELPAHKVYEDDRVIAILTIQALHEGHTLVIPKKQVDHIWDLEDDDYTYLWLVAKKIANKIQAVYNPPRVGELVEGFGVPHAHIHLVPIYRDADFEQHPSLQFTDEEAEAIAAKLRI